MKFNSIIVINKDIFLLGNCKHSFNMQPSEKYKKDTINNEVEDIFTNSHECKSKMFSAAD